MDCEDFSDEKNCSYISLAPGYMKESAPRRFLKEPVVVHLNISMIALFQIDNAEMKFTADFILSLRWRDFRVTFLNLNEFTLLNTLSEEEVESLWKPQLTFDNALGPHETIYDDKVTALLVRGSKPPLLEAVALSKEGIYSMYKKHYIAKNFNNTIQYVRTYN